MKIFLDDTRSINKDYYYTLAWTYERCELLLDIFRNDIEFISLDYHLGRDCNTDYDILVYMKEQGIIPKHINVHSNNQRGVPKMQEYIEKNFVESKIIYNKVE